jgi:hypothetical protein
MPIQDAEAGHGVKLYYEFDPVNNQGDFTLVAHVVGDFDTGEKTRANAVSTPHEADITYRTFGYMEIGDVSYELNFLYDDETHSAETGVYSMYLSGLTHGIAIVGPNGDLATREDCEIRSGKTTSFSQTFPENEGPRSASVTFTQSGPIEINGMSFGN